MNTITKDHDSDMSFGSSSNSSQTSATHIDTETIKLGTDKVSKIFIKQFAIALVTEVIPHIGRVIEISLMIRFLGLDIINHLAVLLPLTDLMNMVFLCSCSNATNVFIQRNISKNQLIAANIYVAHFFIIAAIWVVICIVVYFAVLANIFSDKKIGYFLLFKGAIGSFICTFSLSLDCYFRSENRTWIIFIKSIISTILSVTITIIYLTMNEYTGLSLTNPAVAFMIAQAIIMIWCIILIFRIPFLDVQYRGIIKFQFKKLFPIRPKILLQILSFTFPQLFVQYSNQIIYLEAALVIKFLVQQEEYQMIQNCRLVVFYELLSIYCSFHLSAKEALGQIASYNMGIKKITRIYESIKYCFIVSMSLNVPLILICIFVGKFFVRHLFPQFQTDEYYHYYVEQTATSATAAAWCQFLNVIYLQSQCLLHLESRVGISILISCIPLIFNLICVPILVLDYKDNTPFTKLIGLSNICNLILGFGFYIYYLIKYKQLFKINLQRKDISKEKENLQANNEIRESVMFQLQTAIEVEDPKIQRQSVANLFDRTHMLCTSTSFAQMRVSMSNMNLAAEQHRKSTLGDSKFSITGTNQVQELIHTVDDDI